MNAIAKIRSLDDVSVIPAYRFTLKRARKKYDILEGWLMSEETQKLPLHEVEREQERMAREVQRLMFQACIEAREVGDVGPGIAVSTPGKDKSSRLHTPRRIDVRNHKSIFGGVTVHRLAYVSPGAPSIHPLDEDLELPKRSFSYEVQRRLVKASVQSPFDEALERMEEAHGESMAKRSAEQVLIEAARDVDEFYRQLSPANTDETGPILVAAVDCKGIPMVKPEKAEQPARRSKGKKANKKKMATVAAVFTQKPRVRTPQEVTESLFKTKPKEAQEAEEKPHRIRPENKRVWASLVKGKDAVIAEVGEEMDRRDPERTKTRVAVTDGERALQKRVKRVLLGVILILDLLHVLEKLWKAAYCFHPEGSPEAEEWVKERTLRILRGQVSQVIKGIRQSATKRHIRGKKRKIIDDVTGYFYRNRDRMRYHEYLAQGLPIASGSVEGACKNIIKDRMERSGMRWKPSGAEAMVKLRATYLSGDFEKYWKFHVLQDQQRLHPKGRWRPIGSVNEK